MDMESFEQVTVDRKLIGDKEKYLKENTDVQVIIFKEEIVQVTAPDFMELVITETDPGFRGDTASGGSKPATLETGAVIRVPFFVNQGDKVRVDTRTDTYLERVK
jgi:elongation factor P